MQSHVVTHMACSRHRHPHSGATTRESEYPVLKRNGSVSGANACLLYPAEKHKDVLTMTNTPQKRQHGINVDSHVSQERDSLTLYPYTRTSPYYAALKRTIVCPRTIPRQDADLETMNKEHSVCMQREICPSHVYETAVLVMPYLGIDNVLSVGIKTARCVSSLIARTTLTQSCHMHQDVAEELLRCSKHLLY